MPQYQRRITIWMIICSGLLFLLFLKFTTPTSFPHYSTEIFTSYTPSSSSARNQHIQNNTLGFEKVFVVGLPERSDKRDALALTSSLTGFKITWIDGIRGESVVDKALPYGVDRVKLWENNVGSWRGHMNAVRMYAPSPTSHLNPNLLQYCRGRSLLSPNNGRRHRLGHSP